MLEKHIEAKVCQYARQRGCEAYKFVSPSRAAVPDRLFLAPGGRCWFIEFKRTGQKASVAQQREHEKLKALGFRVYVVDSVEHGMGVVDGELQ